MMCKNGWVRYDPGLLGRLGLLYRPSLGWCLSGYARSPTCWAGVLLLLHKCGVVGWGLSVGVRWGRQQLAALA